MVNIFKWKHFESQIILFCVCWYLKYPLSYRNIAEMMAERGLNVSDTTILRWVRQYSKIINRRIRKYLKQTNARIQEFPSAYVTISGIEAMHMIRKNQAGKMTPLQEVEFIDQLMKTA